MMISKKILRQQALENLKRVTTSQRVELLTQLPKMVTQLVQWKTSQVVAVSMATTFEIPTSLLIQIAFQQQKTVVVPKVKTKTVMEFVVVTPETIYEKSTFGILEPITGQIVPPNIIDLFVVPGLFFSADGHRIGFGGGYYDRYLRQSKGYRVGMTIANNWQPIPTWNVEEMDQPMDKVIKLTIE
ncbi:5-formyltetrahydrofolate cyclo-ligase [Weissella koreensis]|uniref:5-formyltetrahydrofolate cyclo-ligase n=1 Tax=Weissella koreensis TaxID=165096 RepID=A0A7H1MMF1_9LACO|nr:5-formyltetrahydrofolate cyclo-ligase [Weissella koreensis]AEJ23807.1 5-formyltetrahydrofolate cyclo-ligase [Weissella koreensis KACC 15510]AVH75434.1 5-formyltetrahydrofolate cyclo-ligase [Weissella koreensis]MCZ9311278.1 5-formyltetrahydrofolate cyclo-ligase [Weissella koreensis]QGN20658.1 5-formyltetrahydrofolate cyclo-ligase [Weissella koreensis]QNT64637.1 5-formyltetrahydrofolate cyclo-ligase [Weissella koreensis]